MEPLISLPAGEILLRDEGTMTDWKADVADFRLAPHPVTHEVYTAVLGETLENSELRRLPVTEVS